MDDIRTITRCDVHEHGWTSHLARLAAATTGHALPEWTAKGS